MMRTEEKSLPKLAHSLYITKIKDMYTKMADLMHMTW